MTRGGFTLIEVMISIVVTSVVASLAYAAAQAGFDTDQRVEAQRVGVARSGVVRALLTDVLRHQVEGIRGGGDVFTLVDRFGADGQPADSLRLSTRGVVAPLGASGTWTVSIWRSGDTLRLEGRSDADAEAAPVSMRLDRVAAFDARVIGRGLAAAWGGEWPEGDVAPDAVALTVTRGDDVTLPLLVRRGLERAP